jgi:hypothetical protein
MADNIPKLQRITNLPSRTGGPGTGLRLADEGITAAPFRALDTLGKEIGSFGEVLFIKAQQHEKQDRDLGQKKLLLDIENQTGAIYNQFQTAESPQEILRLHDEHFEKDSITGIKSLKRLHSFGDDLSRIDSKDDVLLDRYKKLNLTEQDTAEFKLNREGYLDRVENKITALVAGARFDVFKETVGLVDQSIINNVRNGIVDFDDGILGILDNYEDNGYPESVNAPLRESAVQFATKTYLDDEFDKGNIEVIQAVLSGQFDDELNDVYKEEQIVNDFKDKARIAESKVKVDQANIKYDPEQYERDFNALEKDVQADKGLDADEKNKVLQTAQVEINRRNAADQKVITARRTEQKNQYSNLLAEGDTTSALKYIDDMDDFEDFEKNKMRAELAKGIDITADNNALVEKDFRIRVEDINHNTDRHEIDKLKSEVLDAFANSDKKKRISETNRDTLLNEIDENVTESLGGGLKDALKKVDELDKQFAFAPDVGGSDIEKEMANSEAALTVKSEIRRRVEKGEDPILAYNNAMKPILEAQSKTLLDRFYDTIIRPFAGTGKKKKTTTGNRFTIKETP